MKNEPFGALYERDKTVFRVWSPFAEGVTLLLYKDCAAPKPYAGLKMKKRGGVWTYEAKGDLNGVYYTYLITQNGESAETPDIYSRSAGINGIRSMVIDMSGDWDCGGKIAEASDAVIYELHIRDFSTDGGYFTNAGKFAAFSEKAQNKFGEKIGLDYIKELGITHIHLLPVMENASVNESAPGYNWGYDPFLYSVPEGSYSTDPYDGFSRVRELRNLVRECHKRDIGVIFDVVYNHTFSVENSPFTKTYDGYYYRTDENGEYSNGSGCGNETATERDMVRSFILDSLCFIAREYHADGFRFDLMGLMDIKTLNICAKKLREINPGIILYGEGWTGGASPFDEDLRAVKKNARKLPGYAMFSDDFRDAVCGSVFDGADKGYVSGRHEKRRTELIKSVLIGGVYHKSVKRYKRELWTDCPLQSVNYTECHDNFTLRDRLELSMLGAPAEEVIAADKMAAALVLLSQGIAFIAAGQELLRSKGFNSNSYNAPDDVNSIKWDDVTLNDDVMRYYKGLIAIRRAYPGLRHKTGAEIRAEVTFRDYGNGTFAMLDREFTLLVNPTSKPFCVDVEGSFEVLADAGRASFEPLYYSENTAECAPRSVLLLKRQNPVTLQ